MKLYLKTFGCSANFADSERIVDILGERSFIRDWEKADLIIINSCGVKGPTEEKIINRIRNFGSKKILVAGCLPRISFERLSNMNVSMIGTDQIGNIALFAEKVLEGERVVEICSKDKLCFIPKSFSFSPVVEIVPISQGCLGACSYCATKFAVRALSEGLRQEVKPYNIRTTVISPGAVATELLEHISEAKIQAQTKDFVSQIAVPAETFARMVAFAINEPADVDVNEILFRPTAQPL